jgi:hypothetical protein
MSNIAKPSGSLTLGVVLGGLVPGLVAWAAIFVVLSTARMRFWQDAGLSGYLAMGTGLLLTLLLPAAAAVVLRFRRVPSVVLSLPGLLPPTVAAVGGMVSLSQAWNAADSPSVDPSQRARIYAEALSEGMLSGFVGSAAAAVLLGVAGTCAALRIWSRGTKPGFGLGAGLAIGLGFLGWVVLVVAYAVVEPLRWIGLLPFLFWFGSWVAATLAGVGLARIDQQDADQRRAAGDLAVAGMSWLGAMAFVSLSSWLMLVMKPFGAVAGESVDPVQKARILAQGWTEASQAFAVSFVFLVPVVLAFVGAQLGKLRLVRTGGLGALASSLALALGVAVPTAVIAFQTTRLPHLMSDAWTVQPIPGLRLPVFLKLHSVTHGGGCTGDQKLLIRPESMEMAGRPFGPPTLLDTDAGCDKVAVQVVAASKFGLTIAADASTPYRRVRCLAAAIARAERIPAERWTSGYKPDAAVAHSYWLMEAHDTSGREPIPPPFDKVGKGNLCARIQIDPPGAQQPAPWIAIHVGANGYAARKDADAVRSFTGPRRFEEMSAYLDLRGYSETSRIVVSADNNLTAGDVLPVVGMSYGQPSMVLVDRALP